MNETIFVVLFGVSVIAVAVYICRLLLDRGTDGRIEGELREIEKATERAGNQARDSRKELENLGANQQRIESGIRSGEEKQREARILVESARTDNRNAKECLSEIEKIIESAKKK